MSEIAAEIDWRHRLRSSVPRLVIGALLGVLALVLAFRGVSWPELRDALLRTDPFWLLAAIGSLVTNLVAYTTRWWLLFAPDHRRRNWWNLFAAVLISQSVNIIVPARLGELARTYVAGTAEEISKIRVFATILVEKVIDLALFAMAIVILLLGTTMPSWLSRSGIALVVTATIVTVAALAVAIWGTTFLRITDRAVRFLPERWGRRLHGLAQSALASLQFIGSWHVATGLGLLSALILLLSVTTNYLLFKACGLGIPFIAALFLMVVLRVGEAPPSLPGKLGVFHYLVVLALALFGVERTFALSYAFVLYAVAVVPVVVAGAVLAMTFRRRQGRAQVLPDGTP